MSKIERSESIIAQYEAGINTKELLLIYGISPSRLYQIIHGEGFKIRRQRAKDKSQ
jgi:Mor family transcriptional regulator